MDSLAKPTPVVLIGSRGRMGRHADVLLEASQDFVVVARPTHAANLESELRECAALVGLDLTVAGCGARHGSLMLAAGIRPVIGTSGVSPEENRLLDRAARESSLGGLVVPNFSLGMWLLQEAAGAAAAYLPRVEIIESHHEGKRDAPSGSALQTAEQMAQGGDLSAASIPIHSIRLPGLVANQEVLLAGPGEVLRLSHETYDLEVYSRGILAALRYVRQSSGVARGIGVAFKWAEGP